MLSQEVPPSHKNALNEATNSDFAMIDKLI